MFHSQTEYHKTPYLYDNVGISNSLISICDPQKHKIHRSVVNPLFAKQSIDRLSPSVMDKVEDAAEVIKQCSEQGKAVDIQMLYRCITVSRISGVLVAGMPRVEHGGPRSPYLKADGAVNQIDIISKSVFGFTQDILGSYDGNKPLLDSLDSFTNSLQLMKHLPIFQKMALKLPNFLSDRLLPGYASFRSVRDSCAHCAHASQLTALDRRNVPNGSRVLLHGERKDSFRATRALRPCLT